MLFAKLISILRKIWSAHQRDYHFSISTLVLNIYHLTETVEPIRFIWLMFALTLSTALSASILVFIEQLKSETEVQEIEIMPSVIILARSERNSQFPDTPDRDNEGGSWSRLSKLSTYVQRLDPTLSFVSSIN